MKQALCICGSPNRDGSTARLLAEFARGLADAGVSTTTYCLGERNIGFCTGCNGCYDSRQCVQQDDMGEIMAALLAADIVCIGSPSYWGDVTAQLKAFFDRSTPYCDTRPGGNIVPPGKLGVAVAVRAGRNAAESLHLIESIEHYFGHLGIRPAARLHLEFVNSPIDLEARPEVLARAYEIGRTLASAEDGVAPPFEIAAATEVDAAELAEMNRGLILDEGSDNPMMAPELEQRMREFLRGEFRALLIRTEAGTAGYCLWRPEEDRSGGKPGVYIRQYYIKPECRRRGLGRAALRFILDRHLSDAAFVTLDVLESNPAGRAFWVEAGFKPVYHRLKLNR